MRGRRILFFLGLILFFEYSAQARWFDSPTPTKTPLRVTTTGGKSYGAGAPSLEGPSGGGTTVSLSYDDSLETCRSSLVRAQTSGVTSLFSFLNTCPYLANQILWENGDRSRLTYRDWPREKKDRLDAIYQRIASRDEDLGLACPHAVTDGSEGLYTAEEAFDMFAAQVAHALYLEINRIVPWSLLDRPVVELREFFASYQSFSRIPPTYLRDRGLTPPFYGRYIPGRDFQRTSRIDYLPYEINCDPRIGYRFLSGRNASDHVNRIGANPEETLINLTWFFAKNVQHGPSEDPGFTEVVHYRQQHPALVDRLSRMTYPSRRSDSHPAILEDKGCWAGATLFYDLLKSVNIPVLVVSVPHFTPSATRPLAQREYNTHRGIMYNFGSAMPLVLHHFDEINAYGFQFSFPLRPDGTPVSEGDLPRFYFYLHWKNLTDLAPWGFVYSGDLTPVGPGHPFARTGPFAFQYYDDEGPFGGYWSGPLTVSTHEPVGKNYMEDEKLYALCDWYNFLEAYCSSGSVHYSLPPEEASGLVPLTHTEEDLTRRAEQCVAAISGGCEEIQRRVNAMLARTDFVGWE